MIIVIPTGRTLVLLTSDAIEGDEILIRDLQSSPAVSFEHNVTLHSLVADQDGLLSAIRYDGDLGVREINATALFVANGLIPITDAIRDRIPAIAFAGLAAGVKYGEHAELVRDGARAARQLLVPR